MHKKFKLLSGLIGLATIMAVIVYCLKNRASSKVLDVETLDATITDEVEEESIEASQVEITIPCDCDSNERRELTPEQLEKVKEKIGSGDQTVMKVAHRYHLTRREAYAIKRMVKEENDIVA